MTVEDDEHDYVDESVEVMHGVARWVPPVVVLTALGGFILLAWYAYQAGTQSVDEKDLMVVEADNTPIKEKPEDPGGMQFPNKDKMIFETFSNQTEQHPKVERLMPEPEEPVAVKSETTTTFVNEKVQEESPKENELTQAEKKEFVKQATLEKDPTSEASGVKSYRKGETEEKTEPEVKVIEAKPEPKTEPKQETQVQPKPQREVKPAAGGKMVVQLGAYRSHDEAESNWKKIQDKNSSMLSGRSHVIVRADLGTKGVFYRLRIPGFSDMGSAQDFCHKLSARGQACMATKG